MSQANKLVVEELANVLADTYVLAVKTQNFHWHVTGPNFYALHLMFENQYNELIKAIDELAEHLRALDQSAPASMAEFLKRTSLKESTQITSASEMLKSLYNDHQTIVKKAKSLIAEALKVNDDETADLVIGRVQSHQKTAWMLKSSF